MEADRLHINKEIAMAEARAKVYEEHMDLVSNCSDDRDSHCSHRSIKSKARSLELSDEVKRDKTRVMKQSKGNPCLVPIDKKAEKDNLLDNNQQQNNNNTSVSNGIDGLHHLNNLCQLLKIQSAPEVEMDSFSGNPLDFRYFMSLFKELVESKVDDPLGKLARLIQYTRGEAKELIQHCVQMPQPDGFNTAKELLTKEYGEPHKVTAAYMKELRAWQTIPPNNVKDLKKFYRFLLKCNSNRVGDTYLTLLDNPETLRNLQLKLPFKLQERWRRKAVQHREMDGKELRLTNFLEFVRLECKVLEDPVYSQQEGEGSKEKRRGPFNFPKANNESVNLTQVSQKLHDVCLYCKDNHDTDMCEAFVKLPHKEKRAFLYEQKICFYCFGVFSVAEHGFNKCKDRRTCRTCGEFHPTVLHRENKEEEPVESALATHTECSESDGTQQRIGMPVLPVLISHEDCPDKEVTVYALLDFCSSGVFVREDVINELEVPSSSVAANVVNVKTLNGPMRHHTQKVSGLRVRSIDRAVSISLGNRAYIKEQLPVDHSEIICPETIEKFNYLQRVAEAIKHYPTISEQGQIPIALIIGSNIPRAVEPIECIPSEGKGPFAYRTGLGWCIAGPSQKCDNYHIASCHRIQVIDVSTGSTTQHEFTMKDHLKDLTISEQLAEMYMSDFNENSSEKHTLSVEDRQFIKIMKDGEERVGSHHQLPLPLRNPIPTLPDNRSMAMKRLQSVKKRMLRDHEYKENYIQFMSNLISRGHARKADSQKEVAPGMKWFVPHHGVKHPKTGKFRVVMDCSAEFQGRSLNAELLQGPDNTNLLLGVLLRFRLHPVPVMGDLEQMFYQIFVPENQRSLVRFLWWENDDISQDPVDHEMCVHTFGAISSPSVAGYALRKTAYDGESTYGEAAAAVVVRNFYVDDMCKSNRNTQSAIAMIKNVQNLCSSGGFNLTKLISSSREVLESIPDEKRAKNLQNRDISKMNLPVERALGVIWDVENDTLGFRIQLSNKPLSRRVILSDISSAYDPDGRGSAFFLRGKKILQEITAEKKNWDEPVSEYHTLEWNKWRNEIVGLQSLKGSRCYAPGDFGQIVSQSIHCFSDASSVGYGVALYIRSVNIEGKVHVALAMAKSRVSPLKFVRIPRLELTASAVSVKVSALLLEEIDCPEMDVHFWTDSTIVLGYIRNETKRFRTYVANRIHTIHSYSSVNQWRHVPSELNPADLASRGLSPASTEKVRMWFDGPDFLWKDESEWPHPVTTAIDEEDEEVKPCQISVNKTAISEEFSVLTMLENKCSSWYRLVRRMAAIVKFISNTKTRVKSGKITKTKRPEKKYALSSQEIKEAEKLVLKLTQRKYMLAELELLTKRSTGGKAIRKFSSLYRLSPCLDDDGLICVGGRLRNSGLGPDKKHPVVVPKASPASVLLIRRSHERVAHGGRGSTLNRLRQDGLWVIGAHGGVRSCIDKCRTCRELRGKLSQQKMADLPAVRVEPSPPFSHCGADMFGPFTIQEGRKELKRYGCLFTCMSSRAVHIEVTSQLCADTLIQALRRFIARRGQVSTIRTDNGTNFVGAENELRKCLDEMNHDKVREFLLEKGCDWIVWEKNPPSSSHMGGVWERQIRSIRAILTALMKEHARILNGESLRTFMAETEAIINSRPLTIDTISDPLSPMPLSPIQLLTFKSDVIFPPPGEFQRCDLYCRKHWRRVQFLANQFWHRWRVEYLASLQVRQKWTAKTRNLSVGDIVLVKDDEIFTNRNGWPMARVEEVYPSSDEMVRKVKLKVASKQADKTRFLVRPIAKLVLLVASEDQ